MGRWERRPVSRWGPSDRHRQPQAGAAHIPHARSGLLVFLLFALALAVPAAAAQPAPADLDAVFAEWDREDSPGCAAGALRNGEFVYRGAYGMANLDYGIPLTPDSIFRMASVSKQFTVAAVLVAEDRACCRSRTRSGSTSRTSRRGRTRSGSAIWCTTRAASAITWWSCP